MIVLHQYPSIWGLPSLSPFCVKVETYLRMVGLPYEISVQLNPKRGPKGKMPVLHDGKVVIPDSTFILSYLKQKYGDSLDQSLSLNEQAKALAVQRLIEESLYHAILFSRWIDPKNRSAIHQAFSPLFPQFASLALFIIRKKLVAQSMAHGMGRHSGDEIYQLGIADIRAIAQLFSNDDYFLGKQARSIDATVYGFLETLRLSPIESPLKEEVERHPKLLHYCRHMRKKYFSDLA